jgi:lambda family phage minor tail protein L
MSVEIDVARLAPLTMVEMFEYNGAPIGDPTIFRWHPGTTVADNAIVWQGITYQPFPIESTGFEMTAAGKLPRPTLRASNIGGSLGAFLRSVKDGLGAAIYRRRTLGKYLDAVNFPGGNPNADPNTSFPDEIFIISRKVSENPIFIEIELAVPFDVAGVQLPWRQVIAGTCQWLYRGPDCGYAGPPVQDVNGNPTSDPALDMCRKTLTACKARFGEMGVLPTSAFPASLPTRMV